MSLFALEAILGVFAIRGHIPHNDGFPDGGTGSSFTVNGVPLLRVLIAAALSIGLLSLAVWAAVWLAIRLL